MLGPKAKAEKTLRKPKMFTVQLLDLSQIAAGSRVAFTEIPWGVKNKLTKAKDIDHTIVNFYDRNDELMIAGGLFDHFKKSAEFPGLREASTGPEKERIVQDEFVSSHFLNMLKSLRINLSPADGKAPLFVDADAALKHCFFYTADDTMLLLNSFTSFH